MTLESGIFYAVSVVLIVASLIVVTTRQLFRGALALAGALGAVAALYAMLGADFLAAAQLLVYIGGVVVLVIFVIMFIQSPDARRVRQTGTRWGVALALATAVAGALIHAFHRVSVGVATGSPPLKPTTAALGRLLLGDLLVPFEAVSLILLAALVGAVVIGQERDA